MNDLFFQLALFSVGIFVLVKSADYFVGSVEKLSVIAGVPRFLAGLVVLSLGTSLPEMATSFIAVYKDETDLIAGNVLGSNIANIFLGIGLMVFLAGQDLKYEQNIFQVHFPVLVMGTGLAAITMQDGVITWGEGMFFLGLLAAYSWFLFSSSRKDSILTPHNEKFHWYLPAIVLASLVGLAFASELVVRSLLNMATVLEVEKSALAATLLAVGTSLPEMVVVLSALRAGHHDMAVGNILGSNIFNLTVILGPSALLAGTLVVSDLTIQVMIPFLIFSLMVYWVASKDREITRQEGLAMSLLYLLFVGKLYGWV